MKEKIRTFGAICIVIGLLIGYFIGELNSAYNAILVNYDTDKGIYEIYYPNLNKTHQYEM